MKSVNRTTLMGHIVAKPELRKTKSGKSVSSLAVATNNEWYDAEGTLQKSVDFHRIVAWDKLAEICAKHLEKGTPIYVEGRLSHRSYEGKDKMRFYVTEVIASAVHILRWKNAEKSVVAEELAPQ